MTFAGCLRLVAGGTMRRTGQYCVNGLTLWRTEVTFHRAPSGSNRVSRRRVFRSSACGEQRGHQQRCDRIPGHEHPSPVVCSFDVTVTCRDVRHFDTDQFARLYVKYRGAPRQSVRPRSYACESYNPSSANTPRGSCARATLMMNPYTASAAAKLKRPDDARGAALQRKTSEHHVHHQQRNLHGQPAVHERVLVEHRRQHHCSGEQHRIDGVAQVAQRRRHVPAGAGEHRDTAQCKQSAAASAPPRRAPT